MTDTRQPARRSLDAGIPALRTAVEAELDSFLTERWQATGNADWRDGIDILRKLILGGGKRTRPTFCYLGWRAFGGDDRRRAIIRVAAALEMFHAFALIHDDVMDDSDTRRGRPSLHISMAEVHRRSRRRGDADRFGRNAAILWGDLCLAWSDELFHAGAVGGPAFGRALGLLHRMRSEVLMGQYLDIRAEAARAGLAESLDILLLKSARYTVERPLQIGATLAGAEPAQAALLSRYGIPIGEAFQLCDDVLGVFGNPAVTGKSALTDLRDGKPTVLIALAREKADPAQAAALDRWYGDPDLTEPAAERLREIIVATGALHAVERMIATRTETAVAALDGAAGDARSALEDLAWALSDRRS